jgi:hypothetical protein
MFLRIYGPLDSRPTRRIVIGHDEGQIKSARLCALLRMARAVGINAYAEIRLSASGFDSM